MWDQFPRSSGNVQAVIQASRRAYLILASNSLLWGLLADFADSALVSLALTAVAIGVSELQLIARGFQWLLYLYLIYRIQARLLPNADPAAEVFSRPGLKLLIVLLSATVAIAIESITPTVLDMSNSNILTVNINYFIWYSSGWFIASATLTMVYIYTRWFRYAQPTDRLAFVLQTTPFGLSDRAREREIAYQTYGGRVTSFHTIIMIAGSSLVVVLICALLGLVGGAAGMMFPVAEVVVLLGVSTSFLPERLLDHIKRPLAGINSRTPEPEGRFYGVLRYALFNYKGTVTTIIMILGFVLAAMLVVLSVLGLSYLVYLVFLGAQRTVSAGRIPYLPYSLGWWTLIGWLLCIATPGLYALWFWIRETYRLPHYLRYWARLHSEDAEIEVSENLPRLVTRPPGYLLPMIPPFFLGVLFLNVLLRENALLWPWDLFFAVSWPLVLAGVSWTIRWTLRNEPQHPRTDGHAFPIAFVVQWGGFFLLIPLIPGDYNPDWGLVLFGAPLAVLLFYVPEIAIYLETEYNDWIFGGGIGGLTGVLGVVLIATNWWPALGWLLLLAGVVILVLMILGEYVERISYTER